MKAPIDYFTPREEDRVTPLRVLAGILVFALIVIAILVLCAAGIFIVVVLSKRFATTHGTGSGKV